MLDLMIVIILLNVITTCYSYMNYNNIIIRYNNKDLKLYNNNNDDNNNEILEYDYSTGIVMKKKLNGQYRKRDDRESLPFSITIIDNNIERSLGIWHLDASTSNGDILALGKRGTYVVDKVSYLYKYTGSSFKVFKKKLSVTSINSWNNDDTVLQ